MVHLPTVTRKGGTPGAVVSRDPAVVTQRILNAAEAVFMEDGFAGASTNAILARFGGSKATLFRHFATKEAMLLGVIRRIGEDIVAAARWPDTAAKDPREWLETFGRAALTVTLSPRAIFVGRMVVAQGRNLPALRDTFTAVAIAPMLSELTDRFTAWHAAGLIDCSAPEEDAVRYFDLLLAGWISRSMFGLPAPSDPEFATREAQAAARLFLDGRRARRSD